MTQTSSRLIAAVLIVVVAVGGLGYLTFAPKAPTNTVTINTEQTTILASETTESTSAGAIQSISYYLSLLESTKTEPYVTLAIELEKLPDLSNSTAVAQITLLALNAQSSSKPSGPEVKEAFELILEGGTLVQSDFRYPVPEYNTQLEVLYWLANSTQFGSDDTLALSVAISNGLWAAIGDDQVREAVKENAPSLLSFF